MTSNEEQDYVSGGSSKIPVFTEPALLQQWLLEVNLWEFTQTKHMDKLGAKLLTAQTDPQVKRVMLEVPIADIKTEAGLQKILDRMATYYGKKSESLAWAVFSSWFQGSRPQGETVEVFTRKFLSLFAQVETHDKEVKCSDRMLAMVLLLQLNTTKKDRAAILAFMKDEISPMAVVHAVHHLYDGELPWSGNEKMDDTEMSMFTTQSKSTMRWNADGSISEEWENGDKSWVAPEMAEGYVAWKKNPKGRGKGSMFSQRRHPKEGDESKGQKNQGGLKCYDCNSPYHLSGSVHCKEREVSMFSRNEPEEFSGFAGFAAAALCDDDEYSSDDDVVLGF